MATHVPPVAPRSRSVWLTSALLGAALGGIVLGVGGRIAPSPRAGASCSIGKLEMLPRSRETPCPTVQESPES